MRAPVEFVVTRHLLTDPEATPTQIARSCHVERSSASRALTRLRRAGLSSPGQLLAHLQDLPQRPHWPTYPFAAPNPDNWVADAPPHWLTGQAAASMEGLDLVPSMLQAYVRRDDLTEALATCMRVFAKPCGARDANLVILVADEWLPLDPDDRLVPRGQRLLDYARDPNVQFAKELQRLV